MGKTWDFQCRVALGIELAENIRMISESIAHAATVADEVMFDAEHFFDGYKANPVFALDCVRAAVEAGAAGWFCAIPTVAPCRMRSMTSFPRW